MSTPEAPSRTTLPWASKSKSQTQVVAATAPRICVTGLCLSSILTGFRLDQEAAIDEDEDAFDPDQDARDYDEVARSLSVFCVSARAYQKLSGRLKKDSVHVEGFTEPEDTEIPQLQEHAKRLTEGGRASSSRRFLNDLIQLLNSMKLWVTDDGRMALGKKEQKVGEMFMRARVAKLQKVRDFQSYVGLLLPSCLPLRVRTFTRRSKIALPLSTRLWINNCTTNLID